jgi:hypothetical protein
MLNCKNNSEESKNHPVLELTLVESYNIRSFFLQISNNWLILSGGQNVISKNFLFKY